MCLFSNYESDISENLTKFGGHKNGISEKQGRWNFLDTNPRLNLE